MNALAPEPTAAEWQATLPDVVTDLAWSPDDKYLAAVSAAGDLAVFEAESGAQVCRVLAHQLGALRVSWGAALVTAGQDGKVKWWEDISGKLLREEKGGAAWVENLAWSPNRKLLASASGKFLRVWDNEGALIFSFDNHASTIAAVAWRPDGRGIASACYGAVNLFRLGEYEPYETLAWRGSLISLAWSPNARYVAAGSQEASLRFWRLPYRAEQELEMTGYPQKIKLLAWDCASRFLATGGAGETIMVWDVSGKGPAGKRPKMLRRHEAKVSALLFQKDGDLLVSGDRAGEVCSWQPAKTSPARNSFETGAEITALALTKHKLAAGNLDGRIVTLDLSHTG